MSAKGSPINNQTPEAVTRKSAFRSKVPQSGPCNGALAVGERPILVRLDRSALRAATSYIIEQWRFTPITHVPPRETEAIAAAKVRVIKKCR